MKRKTSDTRWLTIATIMLLIIGPTACFWFEEQCPRTSPYFAIHGLGISNLTFTAQGTYPYRFAATSESIKYDSFFMKVSFAKTYYSKLNSSAGQYMLHALSCKSSGYLGSQVGIDTLYVVSVHDYNNHYFQNDTLNDIVLTNYTTYTVEDFNNFFPLEKYIQENKGGILRDELEFKITEPPSVDNVFRFKLILILNNGERFEATSEDIRLTR
jgi:hypothetical protein